MAYNYFLVLIFQVEGGFVQGQGLFTLEEIRFSQTGSLWTTGPGTYKIPGFADVPVEFNVHLLRNAPNEHVIYSSKVRFCNIYFHRRGISYHLKPKPDFPS